jgi:phosphoribosylformylglycinamidine synthase
LNFGNPEHPDVMWQFAEAIAGMTDACNALGTPVTGGNVSFYNQSGETQIHPTPVVGMVGILEDAEKRLGLAWPDEASIILLGETRAELGGSEWAFVAHGHLGGTPPALDLDLEMRLTDLLCDLSEQALISSAHDCSDGGLGVTLAECAIGSGVGGVIETDKGLDPHVWLFSESASRAVVTAAQAEPVLKAASEADVPARVIGRTGGRKLLITEVLDLEVSELAAAFEGGLPSLLA